MRENPKHIRAMKDGKAPLEYLVYSALEGEAAVLKHGADKYGVRNWLKDKIRASTYEGALLRHFKAWAEGQDIDPDSGHPHLQHIRACCAILLDSKKRGTLIDDRTRSESIDQGNVQPGGVWLSEASEVTPAMWHSISVLSPRERAELGAQQNAVPVETPEEKRELDFIESLNRDGRRNCQCLFANRNITK